MRGGTGGKAAVATASALIAFALAGSPLYVSSATSEALQTAVASTCPSDTGLLLHVDPAVSADLDARAAGIDHLRPPLHTELTTVRLRRDDGTTPAYLVWRDGLASPDAGSIAEPPANEVALPISFAAAEAQRAGDRIEATAPDGTRLGYTVAGIYPDVPVQPAPAYWCGLSELLVPDGFGDAPAPVFLAARATVRSAAAGPPIALWEARPDPDHLTRTAARALADDLGGLAAAAADARPAGGAVSPVAERPTPGLARLIDDAEAVGDTVSRSLIGVRLAVLVVALGLLVVAARRTAQAQRAELTLRLVHGELVGSIALRLAERLAVAVIGGSIVGAAGAYAAVRGLGPAPDLDGAAVRRALILAAGGLIGSLAIAAVTGALRADRWVDHRPPAVRRRFVPPWEVIPVVLAMVAYGRLDRAAGVRIAGTGVAPGDGLGDAFPVLALITAAALVVRPLRWLLRRARHGGQRLGPGALRGWRRLGADPGRHAWLAALVVVGVGATVVASSLGITNDRLVEDKATTFLGSDLRVVTAAEPRIPDGLDGTAVSRLTAVAAGQDVQVIGIDPDTFAGAVHWRDDAAEYPLAELLRVLAVDDMKGAPLPAVVVGGPVPERGLRAAGGVDIHITPVATAAFFPGKTSVPLVVVNRDALAADEVPAAAEVWLRDPPDDAPRVLAAAGNLVRGSQGPHDVFDAGSIQAVRWADHALWVLAAVCGVAALVAALLIVATRRSERQAARAVGRRLGEPAHQEVVAALVACGVPALVGLALGAASGALVVRLWAEHADPVGNLPPPVRIAYDLLPAAVAGAALAAVVLVAAVGSRLLISERAVGEVRRRAPVV